MNVLKSSESGISSKIVDGLERLASALRSDRWAASEAANKLSGDSTGSSPVGGAGLHPTQYAILEFVVGRAADPVRLKDVAAHLGVSGPTATDSVKALERKGLIVKSPHPDDARALLLSVTPVGLRVLADFQDHIGATASAVACLAGEEQADLLLLVTKLIRNLQVAGAISPQRLCVTCRHFRPFAHSNLATPHHCEFVNAAFGTGDIQVDCGDHEAAETSDQAATWSRFTSRPH